MDNGIYNEAFHKNRNDITKYSAKRVLGILNEIYEPKSLVDVGGGIGVWVKEFLCINNDTASPDMYAICIDGDYIKDEQLVIPKDRFVICDLEKEVNAEKKAELAVCLEVAEHLPNSRAISLVNDLTEISDVVLFSAAVVEQGGQGHINEQFLSYWVDLFEKKGYRAFDVIRPAIYGEEEIPWWYRQNMMVYVNDNNKELCNKFENVLSKGKPLLLCISEELYKSKIIQKENIYRRVVRKMMSLVKK